jgi:DNA-directed RNA polymerase subunit H (RpoH/RPB5)
MASQNSSSIISSVFKSRQVVLDLMKRQGYDTSDYDNFSVNEVNAMYQNEQLDMLLEQKGEKESDTRKIYIRYYINKTLSAQNIQDMMDDLFHLEQVLTKKDTLMIITKNEMNETMMNTLKQIWAQDSIMVIIQSMKRLQFNILEHTLVPPHKVLNTEELDVVKKRYNIIENSDFPEISRFDPVAQVIGIRPNEVCEIIRPSKTAINGLYYRVCV